MSSVPRLRDTLTVRRIGDGADTRFSVCDGDAELFRLTAGGWRLLTLLDGVSEEADVLERYRAAGDDMDEEGLRDFCEALGEAGVLNAEGRAVRVLTYLHEQQVAYRRGRPDRREVIHPDSGDPEDPRAGDRRGDGDAEARFQAGIAHLNDGRLEQGLATFRALSTERPGDVRLGELIGHLEFLAASEADPDLATDRRDPAWEAFDRALSTLLAAGRCPSCEDPIEVQLYGVNRCSACGASFTATALRRAAGRRGAD